MLDGLPVVQPERTDRSKIWDFSTGTLRCNTPTIGSDVANKTYADTQGDTAVWGGITGTLSAQSDLHLVLGAKENIIHVSVISTDTNAGAVAHTHYIYFVSGTTTLTLPTSAGNNCFYTVKNIGTGTVTIAPAGGETIDGSANAAMPVQYTSLDIVSDSANWNII